MIDESPLTNNITKISVDTSHESFIQELKNCKFSTNQTYGFEVQEEDVDSTTVQLTSTSPTKIQRFDDNQQLVSEDIIQTDVTEFRIDFKRNFLEVFSNKDKNGDVINRLGQATSGLVTYDHAFELSDLYHLMVNHDLSASIDALRINNFSLRQNTNGSCFINVYDSQTAEKIIEDYESDITYFSTTVELNNEEITVGFFRSGSIRIYSKTDRHYELLEIIKDLLYNVGGGAHV